MAIERNAVTVPVACDAKHRANGVAGGISYRSKAIVSSKPGVSNRPVTSQRAIRLAGDRDAAAFADTHLKQRPIRLAHSRG